MEFCPANSAPVCRCCDCVYFVSRVSIDRYKGYSRFVDFVVRPTRREGGEDVAEFVVYNLVTRAAEGYGLLRQFIKIIWTRDFLVNWGGVSSYCEVTVCVAGVINVI